LRRHKIIVITNQLIAYSKYSTNYTLKSTISPTVFQYFGIYGILG
jgi:hypothetical protein